MELKGIVLDLRSLADYREGSVVSLEILKGKAGTVTLFAFDRGEGLSEHTAPFDALVTVLDGEAEVTLGGARHKVAEGEAIILPADVPHAIKGLRRFKMLLVMIRG